MSPSGTLLDFVRVPVGHRETVRTTVTSDVDLPVVVLGVEGDIDPIESTLEPLVVSPLPPGTTSFETYVPTASDLYIVLDPGPSEQGSWEIAWTRRPSAALSCPEDDDHEPDADVAELAPVSDPFAARGVLCGGRDLYLLQLPDGATLRATSSSTRTTGTSSCA